MGTSKRHGKYIETPEKLLDMFQAYKKDTKDNPRTKPEYVGKDGDRVDTPLERPLTMAGFETYVSDNGGPQGLEHYFANTEGRYEQYRTICSRIRKAIRADQIEGGMVGQYNPSITQRLNNLKEHSEVTTDMNVQLLNNDPLSDDEA